MTRARRAFEPGDWVAVYLANERGRQRLHGIGRVRNMLHDPDGRSGPHVVLRPYSCAPPKELVVCECFGRTVVGPLTAKCARALLSDDRPGVRNLALRAVVELEGRR